MPPFYSIMFSRRPASLDVPNTHAHTRFGLVEVIRRPCALLQLGHPIEPSEVCLPADGNNAREQAAVLDRDEGEGEGGHPRPELARVDHARRDGVVDALEDLGGCAAGEDGLGSEEVGVEGRREEQLTHDDLGGDGEDMRRVVEAVREPHEPRKDQ